MTRRAFNPWAPCKSSNSTSSVSSLQVAGSLEVIDIFQVFRALLSLGVDDGNLARLGQALGRAFDYRLVNAFLNDLMADIISPGHFEVPLIRTEEDGER